MSTSTTTAASLSDDDLAAMTARLDVRGLFVAHAHTDMTRLLAEVRRLRDTHTNDATPPAGDRRTQ